MTAPDKTTELFLTGWAVYLDAANVGLIWDPTMPLEQITGAIPISAPPTPDTPDMLVTLTARPITPDPTGSDVGMELGVRHRATDWRGLAALRDATSRVLLGLYGLTLSTGIPVVQVTPAQSSQPFQEDHGARRWWAVDDYDVLISRPTPHRNR